jgi:hypothetical protein
MSMKISMSHEEFDTSKLDSYTIILEIGRIALKEPNRDPSFQLAIMVCTINQSNFIYLTLYKAVYVHRSISLGLLRTRSYSQIQVGSTTPLKQPHKSSSQRFRFQRTRGSEADLENLACRASSIEHSSTKLVTAFTKLIIVAYQDLHTISFAEWLWYRSQSDFIRQLDDRLPMRRLSGYPMRSMILDTDPESKLDPLESYSLEEGLLKNVSKGTVSVLDLVLEIDLLSFVYGASF